MIPIQHGQFSSLSVFGFIFDTESIFIAIGICLFFYLFFRDLQKSELSFKLKDILFLCLLVLVGAVIGSQLWTYLVPWRGFDYFLGIFTNIYWQTASFGMIFGGFLGVCIFVFTISDYNKYIFLQKMGYISDLAAMKVCVIGAFLRVGCFLDGHIIGKETNVIWCVMKNGICTHPVALYYIIGLMGIYIFLKWFEKREDNYGRLYDGEIAILFVGLYCLSYFLISYFFLGKSFLLIIFILILFLIISINNRVIIYRLGLTNHKEWKTHHIKNTKNEER
jgi:prolipoprotein diacylglyceryltransferase